MKKGYIISAAALLIAAAVFKFALIGYSFIALVLLAVAAAVLFFGFADKNSNKHWVKQLRIVAIVCICLFFAVYIATEIPVISASFGDNTANADYIVVLGAGVNGTVPSLSLKNRLDAAYAYLEENPDTVCIVTGGQGPGEEITEAECMENWLIQKGIDRGRIVKEEKATSTEENVKFSLEIINSRTEDEFTVSVVSSEYHLYRAKLIFSEYGIDAGGIPGKTTYPILKINYFLREVPAVWKFLIFDKK